MRTERRGRRSDHTPALPRWGSIRNAHRFLVRRAPEEIEAAAELYFGALGYRRRADRDGRLVFRRGEPWAGLWQHALRRCLATVEVEIAGGDADAAAVVTLNAGADVRGRIVLPGDRALFEAELRGFDRFLAGEDVSLPALMEPPRRRHRRRLLVRLGLAAAGAVLGAALAWWLLR